MASVKDACCTLAVTIPPLVLTLTIFTSKPLGAAVVGALASTSPTARDAATELDAGSVTVEPSVETVRPLMPVASSTFVVFGMIVEYTTLAVEAEPDVTLTVRVAWAA
jgi:hypothetical protein